MTHLTGDFAQAVKLSSEVLAVLGRIYPSTAANVVLEATLANGAKVAGETRISRSKSRIERIELRPRRPKPLAETLDAIAAGRSDHARARVAVHQRDPEPAGGRDSAEPSRPRPR